MNQIVYQDNSISAKGLFLILISRLLLFALFQIAVAIFVKSWEDSAKYWMLTATLTNVISILILNIQFKKEGIRYLSIFRFRKNLWKKDFTLFSILALLSVIVVMAAPMMLEIFLWDDKAYSQEIMFQPLSIKLLYLLIIAFPLTIGFAELATYFGYIMPRLEKHFRKKWLAVVLPAIFLSIQHCTLPLVFEAKFILFRGLSYLPFALLIGIALSKRPALLPYFAILHVVLDLSAAAMFLMK